MSDYRAVGWGTGRGNSWPQYAVGAPLRCVTDPDGVVIPELSGEGCPSLVRPPQAAPFDHRGPETRFFLPYDVYVVTTELFWYERMGPEDEPRLAGQAQYQVEHYAIAVRDRGGTQPIGVSSRCQLEL